MFFDRDGVLNEDLGYVYRKSAFKWLPGATEIIKFLKEDGYLLFVISNQSGIARGFYTEKDVDRLHHWMNEELFKMHGVEIDKFYYCPHHPAFGVPPYKMGCQCRKPKPGLIHQAISDFNIDVKASYFIGDRKTDMEAAEAAGVNGWLFRGRNLYDFIMDKRSKI